MAPKKNKEMGSNFFYQYASVEKNRVELGHYSPSLVKQKMYRSRGCNEMSCERAAPPLSNEIERMRSRQIKPRQVQHKLHVLISSGGQIFSMRNKSE